MLKDWTNFEKTWLLVATFVITGLSLFWDETFIGFIASISGIICVVLVAKGKISSYVFGTINALAYGYVAYTYGLYGEAQLNWIFYLPLQFVGFALWYKNRKQTDELKINGEDIFAKRLSPKMWGILGILILISYVAYSYFLNEIGSTLAGIDSLAVVLSVFANFLMIFRYTEQWLLWIVVNVITVVLWVVVLVNSGGNDWSVLAMWVAFLVNSVYGYINWLKISKQSVKLTD
jgi:nicotinamide mononucleotide transporter